MLSIRLAKRGENFKSVCNNIANNLISSDLMRVFLIYIVIVTFLALVIPIVTSKLGSNTSV